MTPERWFSLTVEAPSDQVISDLAEGLIRLGGHAVVEEGLRLTTVLPAPSDPEATLERARALLQTAAGGMPLAIRWEWVPHQDWAELWKRGLAPRRISPRLVVTPSWEAPDRRPGDILVRLDPGVAFGTAEHATTRGLEELG